MASECAIDFVTPLIADGGRGFLREREKEREVVFVCEYTDLVRSLRDKEDESLAYNK